MKWEMHLTYVCVRPYKYRQCFCEKPNQKAPQDTFNTAQWCSWVSIGICGWVMSVWVRMSEWVPGGGMGRGRSGALVFVLLVGLNPASFIADAEGEGATGRLGWTDTKTFLYATVTEATVTQLSISKHACLMFMFFRHMCVCVPVEQEGCPSGVLGSAKLHHEQFASS